jgi:hypothetical protein
MDTRIISTLYSKAPIELFVKVTNLCLSVSPEDGSPCPPWLVPKMNGKIIGQQWGHCPQDSGVTIYYTLMDDGINVGLWDCESQGYDDVFDQPPLYVFPLSRFEEFIAEWMIGEITE